MKFYEINGSIGIEAENEEQARERYYAIFSEPIVTIEETDFEMEMTVYED